MITVPEGWVQVRELGRGAMGAVVEVRHTRFGHRAALKCMTSEPERFIEETRTLAGLNHPNIVRVFDIGPTWMVMELARHTLKPAHTFADVLTGLSALLDALAIAHAWDVLHLDVKPSNILVRDDGSHALADFGVALRVGAEATTTGGSLGFMAPERFDGGALSPATDLYAVGCTAWWMVTGHPPHSPTDWQHAWESCRAPLPTLEPQIPVGIGFHAWVERCLHPIPERRFQSAAEARASLSALGPTLATSGSRVARPAKASTMPTLPQSPARTLSQGPTAALAVPETWPRFPHAAPLEGVGRGAVDRLVVPFVGRTAERERLWSRLREGPGLVVLRGPAGSGKTRLGEEFARAACAWAGALVQRSAQALPNRPGRVVVWLDGVVPDAERLASLTAEALVVLAVRSSRWETEDARLDGAEVLDIVPLEADAVRALLADWVGLTPHEVAVLGERCGSDLGRALAMVRDHLPPDFTLPPASTDTLLAAAWGDRVDGDRDPRLRAAVGTLVEAGAAVPIPLPPADSRPPPSLILRSVGAIRAGDPSETGASGWDILRPGGQTVRSFPGGARWISPFIRRRVLEEATAAARTAAHLEAAALRDDTERWERGKAWLEAGAVDRASEDLFEGSALAIARGRMVEALRVLDALEDAADPDDTLTRARIARARAIVGPSFQSHEAVARYNDIALALTRPNAERPPWRRVFRSALSGRQWLAEARMMPRPAKPWLDELVQVGGRTAMSRIHQAMHQLQTGRNEEAALTLDACLALAQAENHTQHIGVVTYLRWIPRVALGDRSALQPMARDFHVMIDEYGLESARSDANVALGNAYRWFGELDAAADRYARARRAMAAGNARVDLGCRVYEALLARDRGDVGHARASLEVCWGLLRDEGPGWEGFIGILLASLCDGAAREHWHGLASKALEVSGLRLPDIDDAHERIG